MRAGVGAGGATWLTRMCAVGAGGAEWPTRMCATGVERAEPRGRLGCVPWKRGRLQDPRRRSRSGGADSEATRKPPGGRWEVFDLVLWM